MIEHQGQPAAPGLVSGTLSRPRNINTKQRLALSGPEEAIHFQNSIKEAITALSEIANASADDDAEDILEFQIAMLEDETLTGPVLAAIAAGTAAHDAWTATIGAELAGYEAAEDEYFRARATDLKDIADRVSAAIHGEVYGLDSAATIICAADMTPSQFLAADWSGGGIALEAGSASSHVAMLARSRGVPMAVGFGPLMTGDHDVAALDGSTGRLILNPDAKTMAELESQIEGEAARARLEAQACTKPAVTACGIDIDVHINITGPADLINLDPSHTDGVGLVRTEFLLGNENALRDEDRQYDAYASIVAWADGRPVTLRTIDAGGDKPVPGYTNDSETNPFLGLRGLRLSLTQPEIFSTQLRAMARAASLGPVRIMLPMVTTPKEFEQARTHLGKVISELEAAGTTHGKPALGMMVEVPAAAFTLADFAVDFASIGSNDLVQYMTAAARDNGDVAGLCDVAHPAIAIAITAAVKGAARGGFPISICGDAAADPAHLPLLLKAGLTSVSVATPALGRAKLAISNIDLKERS